MRLIPRFKHLLTPEYYLGKRTTHRTNRVVQDGPFKGVRYVRRAYRSVYFPKRMDIGVAEGYFAVGLAMRQPAPVVGFEFDTHAANTAQELAGLNGVGDRVQVHGHCSG